MTQLESEISLIEMMMERLAAQRAILQRSINALSPISRLPPEILTEIFRMTCQASADPTQRITPLFFGGICKEWREIAWSTPLLWNRVCLNVSRKTHGAQTSLLGEWLLRAKSSPLFIKLTSEDEHEAIFCSLRAILDVLVTRAAYWYSFDCLLPPQCHDALKNYEFPILTSVSLRPPKGTISTFSEPPSMFLSAPRLIDVDLSGYNFSAMVLPWDQLRRFKTQFLTVTECLKVLRRSPALLECYLESVYSPESFDSLPLYSDLDLLKVFLIKSAAISLLDNLTLPRLRILDVDGTGPGSTLLSSIRSLVLRSSCNLQSLILERRNESGLKDDDIIACLTMIPCISHLCFVFKGTELLDPSFALSEKLAARFRPSSQSDDLLLPNLACFEYRGAVTCETRTLVDMLSERWHVSGGGALRGVSRLKRAEIIRTAAPYFVHFTEQADLDDLVKEGMEVKVYSIPSSLENLIISNGMVV